MTLSVHLLVGLMVCRVTISWMGGKLHFNSLIWALVYNCITISSTGELWRKLKGYKPLINLVYGYFKTDKTMIMEVCKIQIMENANIFSFSFNTILVFLFA